MMAVGKVLEQAKADILFIDPYAGAKVLEEYALLAPDQIPIRLLCEEGKYKAALKPAIEKWRRQFGASHPLEVRAASPRKLHDRHIMLDGSIVWTIGQSFQCSCGTFSFRHHKDDRATSRG